MMPGKFEIKLFSEIDLEDSFFDTLKQDYPEFSEWYIDKAEKGRKAIVFSDENGLGAFVSLKREAEQIPLQEGALPQKERLKISTLRLAERFRGQRLGEGALGLILWMWQKSRIEEIYVTVFQQHNDLICQLEKFGFVVAGHNPRNELVYIRNRKQIDFTVPYRAFPFISPSFKKGGYLIVNDVFHDTLFPYSELSNMMQEKVDIDAANGISKVYVGEQWQPHYAIGEPVFIYRRYTGDAGKPRYKSCLTSFCTISDIVAVKRNGKVQMTFEKFCEVVGNKSVFSKKDLLDRYNNDKNVTVIKLLYCGYFGSGNNINMAWLDDRGLWKTNDVTYPADSRLSPEQCKMIWREGGIDIDNVLGI